MVLKRIMPCLLLAEKRLVKTINFKNPAYIGDPINAVKIYNEKEVDELVLLDIVASKKNMPIDYDLLADFAMECFMPLAYGGGIKTIDDFRRLFKLGIEKTIVNTLLFENCDVIKQAVLEFGSQSIVASVDVIKSENGDYVLFSHANKAVKHSLLEFIQYVSEIGCGEILLTSVDREGTWSGYDDELLDLVNKNTKLPVIINGGCKSKDDSKNILYNHLAQAAAIGSMAVYQKKDMGVLIRFPKRDEIITNE